MSGVSVSTNTYTRTHTAAFVSDKMQVLLKRLIREYGLSPEKLIDAWSDWADKAVREWLISGHLQMIVIEFYEPYSDAVTARWDFPITYDGDVDDDDLWVDELFFRSTIAKAKAPTSTSVYRIILSHSNGAPDIPGMSSTNFKSTAGLTSQRQGSLMSTKDIMASVTVYK